MGQSWVMTAQTSGGAQGQTSILSRAAPHIEARRIDGPDGSVSAQTLAGGAGAAQHLQHRSPLASSTGFRSQTGVTASVTTWYYAGNATSEMLACTSGGDTWIAP
jgi:hypothetical protein